MPPSPDVEAGLEGDDVADFEGLVALGDEVRRLGVAEAEPVAGVAGESAGELERVEVTADGGVDLAGGSAGLQAGLAGTQGTEAGLEELLLAGGRTAADGERVGEVAPVARDDDREVEQEQVAGLDLVARSAGRLFRSRTGGRRRSRRRGSPARPVP